MQGCGRSSSRAERVLAAQGWGESAVCTVSAAEQSCWDTAVPSVPAVLLPLLAGVRQKSPSASLLPPPGSAAREPRCALPLGHPSPLSILITAQGCCPSKRHHPVSRGLSSSVTASLLSRSSCLVFPAPISAAGIQVWSPGPKGFPARWCKGDQRLSPAPSLLGRASPPQGWLRRGVILGEDAAGEGQGASSSLAALGSDGAIQECAGDHEHLYLLQPTWDILAGLLGPLCCSQPGAAPCSLPGSGRAFPTLLGPAGLSRTDGCCEQGWVPASSGAQGTLLHVPHEPGGCGGCRDPPCATEQAASTARSCRLQFRGKFFRPPTPAAAIHQPQHLLLFFAPAILGCGEKAALMFYVTCK